MDWTGERVYIIGGGSSMPEQFKVPERIINEVKQGTLPISAYSTYMRNIITDDDIVIGINAAYLIGDWFTTIFFGDDSFWETHKKELLKYPNEVITCNPKFKEDEYNGKINYISIDKRRKFGLSADNDKLVWNLNSGAAAINLAINRGATEIFLLGFDMNADNGTHWHKLYKEVIPPFEKHLKGFPAIAKEAITRGVKIVNFSPKSSIDVFEKAELTVYTAKEQNTLKSLKNNLKLKIAAITPHCSPERYQFLEFCKERMKRQTRPPDVHLIIDYPNTGGVDIAERYKLGIKQAFELGCDLVFFIEDDDYYPLTYIEEMERQWLNNGKPVIMGLQMSRYYHLFTQGYKEIKTTQHSSAFCTVVAKGCNYEVGENDNAFYDIEIWKKNKGALIMLAELPCGIKHNIGRCGGTGHNRSFFRDFDTDYNKLKCWVDAEAFGLYQDIIQNIMIKEPEDLQYFEWCWILNRYKINLSLEQRTDLLRYIPSDINEHLEILSILSKGVVTEFGVRSGVSTWALLAGNLKQLTSYDITDRQFKKEKVFVENEAKRKGVKYQFIIGDDLQIQIEPTDVLLIDTFHNYSQLKQELQLHSGKVENYIILHDTVLFGRINEVNDPTLLGYSVSSKFIENKNKQGLQIAIDEFLKENKEWELFHQYTNNNGLTILKRRKQLKMLVCIVNYGENQKQYLDRMIEEFANFDETRYNIDIIIYSNIPYKTTYKNVETIICGEPPQGDWLLMAWNIRSVIAERRNDYDLFLYSENDHLYTQRNIDKWVKCNELLPDNLIPGFIQYEEFPEDNKGNLYPAYHASFDWNYKSAKRIGHYIVAEFTNPHHAGFLLTKEQLQKLINTPNYNWYKDVNSTRINGRVRAGTDVYLTNIFTKVIPISHFNDFLIHHLPNKYKGWKDTKYHEPTMRQALQRLYNTVTDTRHYKGMYSVIVLTMWLKNEYLSVMLKMYNDHPAVKDIIFIDNAPESKDKLDLTKFNKIKYLTKGENIYINPAWNWAVSEAVTEKIIIANDDILITDFNSLLKTIDKSLKFGHIIGMDTHCFVDKGVDLNGGLRVEKYTGTHHPHGFGTLMALYKDSWTVIPEEFKLWVGDTIQFNTHDVHVIKGIEVKTNMSTTIKGLNLEDKAKADNVLFKKKYNQNGTLKYES